MSEIENTTSEINLYSQKSIIIATFIGSPLATGYLMRANFKNLDNINSGNKAFSIGIISTVLIFLCVFMIPESIMEKVPNQLIPAIYTGIVYFIVEKTLGDTLKKHKKNENRFYSSWRSAGIGFVSLFIIGVGLCTYVYLSEQNDVNYEKYNSLIEKFSKNESESLIFYDHLSTKTDSYLANELENTTIHTWKKNIRLAKELNNVENLPLDMLTQNKTLLKYSELRLKAFKLFLKSFDSNSNSYELELDLIHIEINEQLEKLN